MSSPKFDLFKPGVPSDGTKISQLPAPPDLKSLDRPDDYDADPDLARAVNVALLLGQPLLLTGEPGTGKTQLAYSVAQRFDLGQPLKFVVKTTSVASDLFYEFDAMRRFHDSNLHLESAGEIGNYITYNGLGLAIIRAMNNKATRKDLPEHLRVAGQKRSVVLIDEIDKAPRDFSNDLLNEIDQMEFKVKENPHMSTPFKAPDEFRPIVIMTSNSEKDLPEPFLRRCVFYHIHFPDPERLAKIIEQRMKAFNKTSSQGVGKGVGKGVGGEDHDGTYRGLGVGSHGISRHESSSAEFMLAVATHIHRLRILNLKKKPSTAEAISWVRLLQKLGITLAQIRENNAILQTTYSALIKDKDDLELIENRPLPTI